MTDTLRFPLLLSLLTLLATAAALMFAVFGIHWGALARPEVLNLSATYVLQALMAITFVLWPALRTGRTVPLNQFPLDCLTIVLSATPAAIFSWWLSEYSWSSAGGTIAMLIALITLVKSLLTLTALMSQPIQILGQSILLFWYLGGLITTYLHAEFAPSFSDSWLLFSPAYAVSRPIPLESVQVAATMVVSVALLLTIAMFIARRRLSSQHQSGSAHPV